MCATAVSHARYDSIAIIGVGLIGGSIAAAVKQRGLAATVVGIGRSRDRLDAAREAGLLDAVAVDVEASARSELVIVCTPVDRIVADVREAGERSQCHAVITDAGSVKGTICTELCEGFPSGATFVGSHPLAGSEKNGWEHADADLFADRLCILTPHPATAPIAVQVVETFWQSIGMRTKRMSPDQHDRVLALTSHLPHAAASALAGLLTADLCEFAASGFRDTTRIAAGDPSIWTGIFLQNAEHLSEYIDSLIDRLSQLRGLLDQHDTERLHAWLATAREQRELLQG